MTRRTTLPNIDGDSLDQTVDALREVAEVGLGRRGDPLDKNVTFRDLKDGGVSTVSIVGGVASASGGAPTLGTGAGPGGDDLDFGEGDLSKPPRPQNVVARGLSLDTILVRWDPMAYDNHSYAEVFANFRNDLNEVRANFDPTRPIGPDNNTAYFMGRSTTTQFFHENLVSTVPVLTTDFEITNISYSLLSGQWYVNVSLVDGVSAGAFAIGDDILLRDDDGAWELHSTEQTIDNITLAGGGNVRTLRIGPLLG